MRSFTAVFKASWATAPLPLILTRGFWWFVLVVQVAVVPHWPRALEPNMAAVENKLKRRDRDKGAQGGNRNRAEAQG